MGKSSGVSEKLINILFAVCLGILILAGVYACTKIFIADRFTIRGHSMEPTLHTGKHIIVNKLIIGPRVYKDFDFSKPELKSFRLPGFRRLRPGDIAVFNYPEGWEEGIIGFKINYVYAKRCIGVAGDTVSIVNGYYRNSSKPGLIIGLEDSQKFLSSTPDSLLSGVTIHAFEHSRTGWTICDFGPLYVPRKGDVIHLDTLSALLYRKLIVYESGKEPVPGNDYRFKENYCFFGGDNILNSRDSRYIGLVPESFVVGVCLDDSSIIRLSRAR